MHVSYDDFLCPAASGQHYKTCCEKRTHAEARQALERTARSLPEFAAKRRAEGVCDDSLARLKTAEDSSLSADDKARLVAQAQALLTVSLRHLALVQCSRTTFTAHVLHVYDAT